MNEPVQHIASPPRRPHRPSVASTDRSRGLSLLEIIVGLALLVLALVGIYGLVRGSMQSFGFSEDFLEVQQNARVALGQLAEEAKWAQSVQTATSDCPSGVLDPRCLSLNVPRDNPLRDPPEAYRVSFRWNGATRQLERVEEGKELAVLADYVTAMTFTYLDNAGQEASDPARVVRIVADLTLKRRTAALAQEVNVGSDIFLRNTAPVFGPPPSPTVTPPRTPPPTSTRPPENITPTPPRTPTPVPSRTPRRTRTPRPTRTPTPQPTPTPTVRPR